MASDVPAPDVTFLAFLKEMHKWEIESRKRSKQIEKGELNVEEAHRERHQALDAILQRFCLVGDYSDRGIRYQHPPEYNPQTEKILAVRQATPDVVEIFTEQTAGWKHKRKFTLLNISGEWRIAKKHRINLNGEEVEESLWARRVPLAPRKASGTRSHALPISLFLSAPSALSVVPSLHSERTRHLGQGRPAVGPLGRRMAW